MACISTVCVPGQLVEPVIIVPREPLEDRSTLLRNLHDANMFGDTSDRASKILEKIRLGVDTLTIR